MATASFATVIEPIGADVKIFDAAWFEAELNAACHETAEEMLADYERTTATWDRYVEFISKVRTSPNVEIMVGTYDRIYFFLNWGTSVRYATMTEDFAPKTWPNWLGSARGSGGLAYVSTKMPRDGIEPRRFDLAVLEKHGPQFQKRLRKIMQANAMMSRTARWR